MYISTDSMREFIASHECNSEKIKNLDEAVLSYKKRVEENLESSAEFSCILNKVLGVISSQAKKLNNPDFTESDAYSHGIEVLTESIDKWSPIITDKSGNSKKVSFLTYFYRTIHNRFDTLAYRSKAYRSILYRNKGNKESSDNFSEQLIPSISYKYKEISLDELIENIGDKACSDIPKEDAVHIDFSKFLHVKTDFQKEIIKAILSSNISTKKQLKEALIDRNLSSEEFNLKSKNLDLEIKSIRKQLKYVVNKLV